jgi:hypothetical protein
MDLPSPELQRQLGIFACALLKVGNQGVIAGRFGDEQRLQLQQPVGKFGGGFRASLFRPRKGRGIVLPPQGLTGQRPKSDQTEFLVGREGLQGFAG